jgi:hypothetical protein
MLLATAFIGFMALSGLLFLAGAALDGASITRLKSYTHWYLAALGAAVFLSTWHGGIFAAS